MQSSYFFSSSSWLLLGLLEDEPLEDELEDEPLEEELEDEPLEDEPLEEDPEDEANFLIIIFSSLFRIKHFFKQDKENI